MSVWRAVAQKPALPAPASALHNLLPKEGRVMQAGSPFCYPAEYASLPKSLWPQRLRQATAPGAPPRQGPAARQACGQAPPAPRPPSARSALEEEEKNLLCVIEIRQAMLRGRNLVERNRRECEHRLNAARASVELMHSSATHAPPAAATDSLMISGR
jgi:hypothetical protein